MTGRFRLVGRERESSLMDEAFTDAISGRSRTLLLAGEPGIGKTRLAEAVAERAQEHGALVCWGRCWEEGGAPAFWPWVQVLRSLVNEADGAALARGLGPTASHLVQLVPELRTSMPGIEPSPSDAGQARFALFDVVVRVIDHVAQTRPVMIALEDLHAADPPSLLLALFAARHLGPARALLVGTYRDVGAHVPSETQTLIADLGREASVISLSGLTVPDVGSLLADALGMEPGASVAAAILESTGGNPFFLTEILNEILLRGLSQLEGASLLPLRVPLGARQAILRRTSRLSDAIRMLLGEAAVLGRDFSDSLLREMTTLEPEGLPRLLRAAQDAGVLTSPGAAGRHAFAHGLIRQGLYEDLDEDRRRSLHLEAGRALERLHPSGTRDHFSELAHHFIAAGPEGAAAGIRYSFLAGDRALELLAYEEAALHYQRALAALDAGPDSDPLSVADILISLGEALFRAGNWGDARECFQRAATLGRTSAPADRLARAALGHARAVAFGQLDPPSIKLLREALEQDQLEASELPVLVMAQLAVLLMPDPTAEQEREHLSRAAVDAARLADDPSLLARVLNARLLTVWGPDSVDERLAGGTEILELAALTNDLEQELEGHQWRLSVFHDLGDMTRADLELDAYDRVAHRLNRPDVLAYAVRRRALRALHAGDFDAAEELSRRTFELERKAGEPAAEPIFRSGLMIIRDLQGRLDYLDETLPLVQGLLELFPSASIFRPAHARWLAMLGRDSEARAEFERVAINDFKDLPRDVGWPVAVATLAELCAGWGDRTRAAVLYDEMMPFAHLNVVASSGLSLGSYSRYLALLAATLGRDEDAISHFEHALEMNARMGARPMLAWTQYDYARFLMRGRGHEARTGALLEDSSETARSLGMAGLLAKVELLREEPASRGSDMEPSADMPDAMMRREGSMWTIAYGGRVTRLPDAKGLHYLASLLGRPDTEFHVLDLVNARPRPTRFLADEDGLTRTTSDGVGPLLDESAKGAYRRRVLDLKEEIEEATTWGDEERAARAREELQMLTAELAAAVGLGGRDRIAGSAAERARLSVTKAVRRAIARIGESDPELQRHLENSVKTGAFCSYRPEGDGRISWTF